MPNKCSGLICVFQLLSPVAWSTWACPFEGLTVGQQVLVEVKTYVGLQTVREPLQNLKQQIH